MMKDALIQFAATVDKVAEGDAGNNDLRANVINILNVVIGALGVVAVIVIIIGGVGYMTSSGDAGKVKKAKDTILYGIIGLAVCVLAFAIVNWVVGSVLKFD